jgi:tetratricopeptide (TPR) repeat protein
MGLEARLHHQKQIRCADPLVSMPTAERPKSMHVRRTILCLAVFFWAAHDPDVASGQSSQLMEAYNSYITLYQQGRYSEAEPYAKEALRLGTEEFGPNDPSTAALLNNLAELYRAQGKYAEEALGPEHPDVAQSLNNLAELYRAQGRYVEAEPLYKRALTIDENALGPDHPNLATDLNNLALLYQAQGHYAQAEPLYQRSLAIWEKALGPEHPDVATSLENYAALLRQTARTDEAERMEARAKAIRAKYQ